MDLSTSEKAGLAESPGVTRAALGGEAMPVAAPSLPDQPLVTIDPQRSRRALDPQDFYAYRELLYFLAWRDIKVRYKQTALGVAWVLLQPLLTTLVFTVFFGMLARVPSNGLPYALFVFSGLLPWTFFSSAVASSSASLIGSANLISKVYFPRILIPTAAVGARLVDFGVSLLIFAGLMAFYGFRPTWHLLMLPPLIALVALLALGFGMWASAVNVKYRDIGAVLPVAIQLLMFTSPVIYPTGLVPEGWRTLYSLNPLVGILEGFRGALLGQPFDWFALGVSTAFTAALLVYAAHNFRRMERSFADLV